MFRLATLHIVFLHLLFVLTFGEDKNVLKFPIETIAEIIADLQQIKFNSGCLSLLEHSDRAKSLRIHKLLSERHVFASTMKFPLLLSTTENIRCRKNRPLYVIITDDEDTRRYLRELTRTAEVSYPRWLLFLEVPTRPEVFLRDVKIPFDCEFMVARRRGAEATLVEVYQVHDESPHYLNHFADWSHHAGIYNMIHIFYKRRSNLHGHVIRVTATHNPRMMTVVETGERRAKFGGYFGSVWNVLQSRMNFTSEYIRPPDSIGGFLMPNGSWNGMINMVITKQVDVAVRAFTMTSSRVAVVDFPLPIIYTKSFVFLREPVGRDRGIQAFFAPFSRKLWAAVLGAMAVLAIHLTVIYKIGRWAGNTENTGHRPYTFYESVLLIHGIFCQQGYDCPPKSASCRVVYFEAYLVAVLVCAAYSATIVSYLAIQKVNLPFTTFQGLLDDGTYKLEVKDDCGLMEKISTSNDPVMRALYHKMAVGTLPTSDEEGLTRVCREDDYVFMASLAVSQSVDDNLPCRIVPIPQASLPESSAMAFTKGSPYRGIVHNNLLEMRWSGVLSRLLLAAWPKERAQEHVLSSLSLWDIKPLLVMLGASAVAAILVLCLERATRCVASKRSRRRQRRRRRNLGTLDYQE